MDKTDRKVSEKPLFLTDKISDKKFFVKCYFCDGKAEHFMSAHHWAVIPICDKEECFKKFDETSDGQYFEMKLGGDKWNSLTMEDILHDFGFRWWICFEDTRIKDRLQCEECGGRYVISGSDGTYCITCRHLKPWTSKEMGCELCGDNCEKGCNKMNV